jgi:hypothetical protein
MKQTALQQAIVMVRSRMESMDDTLMGKHSAHHLQQVERLLYELLEAEKEQIENIFDDGYAMKYIHGEQYYKKTYGDK